jgi:hypothetical protein
MYMHKRLDVLSGLFWILILVTATGQVPGQPVLVDTIRRHEVDLVLSNQNAILGTARDIKWVLIVERLPWKCCLWKLLMVVSFPYLEIISWCVVSVLQNPDTGGSLSFRFHTAEPGSPTHSPGAVCGVWYGKPDQRNAGWAEHSKARCCCY